MEEPFSFSDNLGPLKVIYVYEPSVSLKGVLVVDNVAAGPSIGGLRMAPDVSAQECFRLARAMTYKNAAAGLPHGGGKSVLFADPKSIGDEHKQQLVRAFACALAGEDHYIFGPDMGTDEVCMAWVKDEIGRALGLPRELGGIPLDEIGATGLGLACAAEVAAEFCDLEIKGARVVVQGFGAVGKHVARILGERGAILVGASDTSGTVCDPSGIDINALIAHKDSGSSLSQWKGAQVLPLDATLDIECEIWIPAARPDVIDEANVKRLHTRLVIQGANIPVTHGAERRLHERSVLNIPDFIANAGGVICAAMEYQGASEAAAMQAIEEKVRRNTREVLTRARDEQLLPREAALNLATSRIEAAMRTRRWSLF
ncbi:MAG: Glu/Leu/Phe/Val dehydrogenase [Gammaproteobacteria bacterium]|nr:Glu/Leu/Phe/Val dehydrogenase [Gammaproteobacteria bacterium]MDH3412269.1 Glu/Leu/Phe/Val dehydrogenase [Gammaproteobacteria bacterium]